MLRCVTTMKRAPTAAGPRTATIRDSLREALRAGSATTRDLSKIVAIPEHDVADHLEHLHRSLKRTNERLVIEPPTCLDCNFTFTHRHRFTRPSGCPQCRGRRISLPRFRIEG